MMKAVIFALLVTLLTVSAFVPSSFNRFGSRSQLNMGNYFILHFLTLLTVMIVQTMFLFLTFFLNMLCIIVHFVHEKYSSHYIVVLSMYISWILS